MLDGNVGLPIALVSSYTILSLDDRLSSLKYEIPLRCYGYSIPAYLKQLVDIPSVLLPGNHGKNVESQRCRYHGVGLDHLQQCRVVIDSVLFIDEIRREQSRSANRTYIIRFTHMKSCLHIHEVTVFIAHLLRQKTDFVYL